MAFRAAIVQATPAVLDLGASVERACDWIRRAGERGAKLVAFPETWVPVYPLWCDTGTFGRWGDGASRRLHGRLVRNSLAVPSPETERIGRAAEEAGAFVLLGANERGRTGTLYNSILAFRPDGTLAGVHRKLVPTFGERLVHGPGDGAGLRTHRVEDARVGGLVCWEHWMPLARQALHAAGETVHVAAWPHAGEDHQLASRHYAFEGRCFVLAAASWLPRAALPDDFELAADFEDAGDVLLEGGSAVIGPDGRYLVEPVRGREELIVADLDLDRVHEERMTLDVAGHYSRPDVFRLEVDRERREG